MFASSASAADPADLQKLKDSKVCLTCDLSEANLEGADLRSAILNYARMRGAILCNTIMLDGSMIYSGC